MTFTGTDHNVCVVDRTTGREKTAHKITYDGAHMTAKFDETTTICHNLAESN